MFDTSMFDATCEQEQHSTVGQRSEEEAVGIADAMNLEAFFPLENEVFLDIDSREYLRRKAVIEALFNAGEENSIAIVDELVTNSKGGNKHVYLRLDRKISPLTRLVVQAVLGSDPVKEALTLLLLRAGGTGAVALFETPKQAERVRHWRILAK